jgi:hypothetical protein
MRCNIERLLNASVYPGDVLPHQTKDLAPTIFSPLELTKNYEQAPTSILD